MQRRSWQSTIEQFPPLLALLLVFCTAPAVSQAGQTGLHEPASLQETSARGLGRSAGALSVPQGSVSEEVDRFVESEMKKQRIVGLSIAVVKEGHVIKSSGYGMANAETNSVATDQTVYKIGSISKQFLSAGVMLLVQDGKLRLDDKVSQYVNGTPPSWSGMTIRNLLTHTAGLPLDPPHFEPYSNTPNLEIVQSLLTVPLLFAPGSDLRYSNVGYFVIAEILREVTGEPWDEFVAQRIFSPLAMNATCTTTTLALVEIVQTATLWGRVGSRGLQNGLPYALVAPSSRPCLIWRNGMLLFTLICRSSHPVEKRCGALLIYQVGVSSRTGLVGRWPRGTATIVCFTMVAFLDFPQISSDSSTIK